MRCLRVKVPRRDDVVAVRVVAVRGESDRNTLFASPNIQQPARAASDEAWHVELGVEPDDNVRDRAMRAVGGSDESVLIGGPPCQAYSLVGRSRNRGNPEYDANADGRHTLYREYLKVLTTHWPAVFVMENVKGLLSARLEEQSVLARILADLHEPEKTLSDTHRTRNNRRYRILALSTDVEGQSELFESDCADPKRFIVRCENHGVPQARHRLILLGVRGDIDVPPSVMLQQLAYATTAGDIEDLPRLRSGLSDRGDSSVAWHEMQLATLKASWFVHLQKYDARVADRVQAALRSRGHHRLTRGGEFIGGRVGPSVHNKWFVDARMNGVANHATRSHIAEDLKRYLFASAFAAEHKRSPTLSDFPVALLPAHRNVRKALKGAMFEDRFRVQLADRPATTVTSHISKDGHYYIHYDPSQCRSLTAREAARLQTFPDNYYFCGGRTAQYQQIGNAVPPYLAKQIAQIVSTILK